MKIKRIIFNWFASSENGEEYTERIIGNKYGPVICESITEHLAAGDGDKWYYDVHYSDGGFDRIFNPNTVTFESDKNI